VTVDPYRINLLPRKLQSDGIVDLRWLGLTLAVILSAALLVGGYLCFYSNLLLLKGNVAAVEKQLPALRQPAAEAEDLKAKRIDAEAALSDYQTLLRERKARCGVLLALNKMLPDDLWLNDLESGIKPAQPVGSTGSTTGGTETPGKSVAPGVTGTSGKPGAGGQTENRDALKLHGEALTAASVGVLLKNMNDSPLFSRMALDKIYQEKGVIRFDITASTRDGF
jgi:Tfp pilus assembly protein PilN